MANDDHVPGSYWYYAPNKGAALFFVVGFLVSTLMHAWQCYRYKCFSLTSLFIGCGLLFVIGYASRAIGAFGHYDSLAAFVISIATLNIGPPLLGLANYHILGRVLAYVPHLAPVPPGRVLSVFGLLAMIIEAVSGLGSAFTANDKEGTVRAGFLLMKVSLALQFVLFACFFLIAGYFHWRCGRTGIAASRRIRQPLTTLYVSMSLILARTIFRTVEQLGSEKAIGNHSQADISPVVRYEWYYYVFETALMFINLCLWNVRHPLRYLPASKYLYLDRDGITETMGSIKKDMRPLAARILDPYDLLSTCRKRDKSDHILLEEHATG